MDISTLIPQIPLWGVLIGTFLLVVMSIFLGYGLGSYHRKHSDNKAAAPIGSVVALRSVCSLSCWPSHSG